MITEVKFGILFHIYVVAQIYISLGAGQGGEV